jgi:hypothetical protein
MQKRILILMGLLLTVTCTCLAQKYITAAGMRIEENQYGLTLQQRVLKKTSIELIGMAAARDISATALAEQHFPLLGRRLNYYFGLGGHIGKIKDVGNYYGFDGVFGMEYKINGLPFLLSFDFKPAVHINHDDWVATPSAFSVRYVFIRERRPAAKFFQRIFKRDKEDTDND